MSTPNTCGNCRHYHLLPRQRDASGAVDFSVPQQGQCRQGPPATTILPHAQGQLQLVGFSTPTADWPACGQFLAERKCPKCGSAKVEMGQRESNRPEDLGTHPLICFHCQWWWGDDYSQDCKAA